MAARTPTPSTQAACEGRTVLPTALQFNSRRSVKGLAERRVGRASRYRQAGAACSMGHSRSCGFQERHSGWDHTLYVPPILQAQRDDRRIKSQSRTHHDQAPRHLQAAPGAKPTSQLTSEDIEIAVRKVSGVRGLPRVGPGLPMLGFGDFLTSAEAHKLRDLNARSLVHARNSDAGCSGGPLYEQEWASSGG